MKAPSMKAPIRIGVIGCGQIVAHHFRGIAATTKAVVVALIEPNETRRLEAAELALSTGAASSAPEQYTDLSMLPKGAVDLLLLCVPHDLHERLCEQALSKCAVVIEKPLASSVEGCRRIIQTAQEHNRQLFVAENSAFWPEVLHAKQLIQQGLIGDLVAIHGHYYESEYILLPVASNSATPAPPSNDL